ncbi:hypothetical protein LIER_24947 [Lithospermum erythrorhizon]|uniref:non-specific serine/threonine protein kinase n=1 Tax=Lithospermum erythrorhizon TaxID=34254 RepID=A0AAV3R461_LITER
MAPAVNPPVSGTSVATSGPTKITSGKRPSPDYERPRVFGARKKDAAHRPKRIETVTISEDPPSRSSPSPTAPAQASDPSPGSAPRAPPDSPASLPREASSRATSSAEYSSDLLSLPFSLPSGLTITRGSSLWKKTEAFQASKSLILERVKKDFDEAEDLLEVQAAIARHLIRSLNGSYSLATRLHAYIDERTDIWSLGCTLFAIMYGSSPFEYASEESGGSLQLAIQFVHSSMISSFMLTKLISKFSEEGAC